MHRWPAALLLTLLAQPGLATDPSVPEAAGTEPAASSASPLVDDSADTDAAPPEDTDSPTSELVPAAAPKAGPAPLGALPPELGRVAREVRHRPLAERMHHISDAMLGRPYLSDPLGEGAGVDADPLARYDVYDCLTFLEEVLALSLAGDPAHAADVRLALRYGQGGPTYGQRRHFMELQWIPGNIRDGWLRDTTAEYGPVVHMEREVTADTWASWAARARFALKDDELPTGTMALDVLDLDAAKAAAPNIRPGTLVLTVRKDRPWKPIWISHVGFVIPAETPTVRHATRMQSRQVRDHGLVWYIDHLRTYDKWPAVGIALLEPVEQGPRALRAVERPEADPG